MKNVRGEDANVNAYPEKAPDQASPGRCTYVEFTRAFQYSSASMSPLQLR